MVESIQNRIHHKLNQPMVAKSKKVKVKSQRRSKTQLTAGLYQAKAPIRQAPEWRRLCHGVGLLRAGELESWSWKLEGKLEAVKI